MTSLLELAADLERRDAAAATEIAAVRRLSDEAREIGARAAELGALLERTPAEEAAIDRAEADALGRRDTADADVAAGQTLVEKLAAESRTSHDLAAAERDLGHAREAARDAHASLARIALRRTGLAEAERDARAELPALVGQARSIAGQLTELSRVSASGRALPQPTLAGLGEWSARVHAALLVTGGLLDVERDRLVREANELGSAVLGEQVSGQSVELVGQRVRMVLAG